MAAPKEADEFAIPEGKGTKLRDIPNVAFKMGKMTGVLGLPLGRGLPCTATASRPVPHAARPTVPCLQAKTT